MVPGKKAKHIHNLTKKTILHPEIDTENAFVQSFFCFFFDFEIWGFCALNLFNTYIYNDIFIYYI